MKDLIKHPVFIVIYLAGYSGFFVVTILLFDMSSPGFGVGSVDYGFPFVYYSTHCFGENYNLEGLFGNIVFATLISCGLGVFCSGVWSLAVKPRLAGIDLEELKRKWYL